MADTAKTYDWAEIEKLIIYDQVLNRSMYLRDTVLSLLNGDWRIVCRGTCLPNQFRIEVFDIINRTGDFVQIVQDVQYMRMAPNTFEARIKQLYQEIDAALERRTDFNERHKEDI